MDLLKNIKPKDKIKIFINLRGREWTNPEGVVRYFNSIQGWKIEHYSTRNSNKTSITSPSTSLSSDDFDDLPF